MEERHQITKLEKYEKDMKFNKIEKYVSIAILTMSTTLILIQISMPIENIKSAIHVILNSYFIPKSASMLVESTILKYYYLQKIDELEKQKNLKEQENQVRI